MSVQNFNIKGLSPEEVISSRERSGYNRSEYKETNSFLKALKEIVSEPMVILLIVASLVYLASGNTGDCLFLLSAIIFVSAISLYQHSRSRNAIERLNAFIQPDCKVIRNGVVEKIKSEMIVVGDCLMVEEGTFISADGTIIHSNDFSVNESVLTGESLPVVKDQSAVSNSVFQGTTVVTGLAIVVVTAIGSRTRLGMIGKSLEAIKDEKTPLELQIGNFVKKMLIAGAVIFLIVWILNYYQSRNILNSLLNALTLAMSIVPEEIPVAFSTFLAIGSWRLMKMGVVVKQIKTVETLGSATVICTDKTGTITENRMSLAKLYTLPSDRIKDPSEKMEEQERELITLAMWASEPIPFDPMEVALHQAYADLNINDQRPEFKMLHEYPLGGKPPMMTHIFRNEGGKVIIAAKGAPEAIMNVSGLPAGESDRIQHAIALMAEQGYRVLAVGEAVWDKGPFPGEQQQFKFKFKGLVAFYDPPKKNIRSVFEDFYKAGISVKIITGDNAATTKAIAAQVGFRGADKSMSGDELMLLSETELREKVKEVQIYTRMFPDAKLRIINALKANGEVVAMTGDGVNDGPALKSSHIGIAMGRKGTEIARQAASLILVKDDLSQMVQSVAMGRKIYANLKKAIRYIISIHVPIILTVFIPLALGWVYPNIFSPVHVIFLELIMGPTCSIIYENEPIEQNTMLQAPRKFTKTFFNSRELTTSIVQGLVITAGVLSAYQYAVHLHMTEEQTRAMSFLVLIVANICLTLVNRSFYYSFLTTLRYRNPLVPLIISVTLIITSLILWIGPLREFFGFGILPVTGILVSLGLGLTSVLWYELVKWIQRRKTDQDHVLT